MFKEHTFSICAYGESAYLEQCIKSILRQSVKSNVIICTSTPNAYIRKLSDKYNIKLYVREGNPDIKDDWNFAYNAAGTMLRSHIRMMCTIISTRKNYTGR